MLYANPYTMGVWDCKSGYKFVEDNPYPEASVFWIEWRKGWLEEYNKQQMEGSYEE